MAALQQLRRLRFSCEEEALMVSRAKDLLDAYVGRQHPPNPAKSWRVRLLEKELFRRFREACAKNPAGIQRFIGAGLPEELRSIVEPYRMAKQAAEMSNLGSSTTEKHTKRPAAAAVPARHTCSPAPAEVQRAVAPGGLGAAEAQLSSAALKLPWSSEECWERRWEQEPCMNTYELL